MRAINTRKDVEDLLRDGTASEALSEHVAEFFWQLEAELADNEEAAFWLDQHGPIILLEAGDDLCNLSIAGHGNANGVPLSLAVEFVEKLDLGEVQAYRLAALLDNDFVVTYFTLAGTHNEEVEQWLSEQAQKG